MGAWVAGLWLPQESWAGSLQVALWVVQSSALPLPAHPPACRATTVELPLSAAACHYLYLFRCRPSTTPPAPLPACRSTGRLEELKARYVAAGSPHNPDWDKLLEGL